MNLSDKSYVTLEQNQCFICGEVYDTGTILMDRRLKKSFDKHTITGTGLCPQHQKLAAEDYIACIVVKEDDKTRTGDYVAIKRDVAEQLFNQELPGLGCYIDEEVFNFLKDLATKEL